MTLGDGFPAASGTVDSTELRKALAGLILRDTSGSARAGIFPRHANSLVTAKASMAVDVAAFEAITVRGGGPIFLANDGTVSVSVDAAPGSNSRIDVVYFKQNESAAPYSDANNLPVIAVEKGTAGAVPVKPTIPTGACELATILIPSGVSATNAGGVVITQTYPYTALTGTALWVRNSTERGALGTYTTGARVLQLDTMVTYRYGGSAWKAWESDWITGTPTTTNITLGTSPTNVMRHRYDQGDCVWETDIILGTGGSVGTNPTVAFPLTPTDGDSAAITTQVIFRDANTLATIPGVGLLIGGVIRLLYMTGSPSTGTGITSSVPFTWTVSDRIHLRGRYRV